MNNEKMLLAKAWDNRIGCAIAINVLKALKDTQHPNVVYGIGAVQEEVGLRGSKTSTFKIQPDIGFAVDVGIAGDTPGISEKEAMSEMGKGPQIVLYDASMVSHKGLRDLVTDTADELNIPYQFTSLPGGGTDAGSIHVTAKGVPALSIGIATRYIHSHAAMLHRDDFENAVKLVVEVIKRLDRETVDGLRTCKSVKTKKYFLDKRSSHIRDSVCHVPLNNMTYEIIPLLNRSATACTRFCVPNFLITDLT